jgi:uncharacterized membrane protein YgcG
MKMLKRLFKHLFITKRDGRKAFPQDALDAIQEAIARGERIHRAEVRLIIEPSLAWHEVLARKTPRQRARELFAECGIWDTEENCGVLVYVNLADRDVEILADRTAQGLVEGDAWESVCQVMVKGFSRGDYRDSAVAALEQLNELLQVALPDDGARANQLSNRPMML